MDRTFDYRCFDYPLRLRDIAFAFNSGKRGKRKSRLWRGEGEESRSPKNSAFRAVMPFVGIVEKERSGKDLNRI